MQAPSGRGGSPWAKPANRASGQQVSQEDSGQFRESTQAMKKTLLWMAVSVAVTVALAIVTGGKALVLFVFLPLFWPWRKR